MGPKKSGSDLSNDSGYMGLLYKLCKEEDVLVIPQLVPVYMGTSPRKSKESKITRDRGSSSVFPNEFSQDEIICGPQPPQMVIVFDEDSPVTVICKNFYIEYTLIYAIGKSLKPFPRITSLKIENCCIGKEIAEALALVLAEEPGRQITDLSLDGNADIVSMLPLFFVYPNGLRYLSLQRCTLDDEAIKVLAEPLAFRDDKVHKLQVLNLGMNKIGDVGAEYLANALRTNRALVSLSLAGNQIGDKGAAHLATVLQPFVLTHEETMLKRRRVFDQILKKKSAMEKFLEEWKMKGEVDSQTSKGSVKSTDRFSTTGRRIRGADGKIRCLSSRDRKAKSNVPKMNSGEKFRLKGRSSTVEPQVAGDPTSEELIAIAAQIDSETPPDKHPFVSEISKNGGQIWCDGNWTLGSLNLAYNYLTENSAEKFVAVFNYQAENFGYSKNGLLRLILLPGNLFQETCDEYQKLQTAILNRNSRKEYLEGGHGNGSITSARRLSSSTRRIKNR